MHSFQAVNSALKWTDTDYDEPELDYRKFLSFAAQTLMPLVGADDNEFLSAFRELTVRRSDSNTYLSILDAGGQRDSNEEPLNSQVVLGDSLKQSPWFAGQSESEKTKFFSNLDAKKGWFHLVDNFVFPLRNFDGSGVCDPKIWQRA